MCYSYVVLHHGTVFALSLIITANSRLKASHIVREMYNFLTQDDTRFELWVSISGREKIKVHTEQGECRQNVPRGADHGDIIK